MRTLAVSLLLLWQMGSGATPSPSRHLRYQREILLPSHASGQACVALDGAVFAHMAGAGDIRIYGQNNSDARGEFEVPFALTESGPSSEPLRATPGNVSANAGALAFDLAMPDAEYSQVALELDAKNFLGAARVEGVDSQGHRTPLGTSAVFDLSLQGLARSTVIVMPDSRYPVLHVELRMVGLNGQPLTASPSIITGATVPPSREAQTIYTTIASVPAVEQQGHWSAATVVVPAHVPVERVQFVLSPTFHDDFLRDATVAAAPMEKGWEAQGAAEGISGHIFHVTRDAAASVPAIDSQVLSINTVIGANLRSPAKVTASVDNETAAPLPIERVDLQMRERRLCFEAQAGNTYMLRYGNVQLSAPSYNYARRFVSAVQPAVATLGPEGRNTSYVAGAAAEEQEKPGRELPWILLIAGVSIAGVTALQFVRHKREGI